MNGLSDLIDPSAVFARLSVTSKRQAIEKLAEALATSSGIDPRASAEAVIARERLAGTGIGEGAAVPHARIEGLGRALVAFARLDPPQDFDALDARPADLVALLLAPAGQAGEHLKALARISRTLRRADIRERLRAARGADELIAILYGQVASDAA